MKNIHLIPTEKPSRFSLNSSGKYHLTNQLHTNSPNFTNQNIYITSDEEIKEGDWVYCRTENRVLISNVSYSKLEDRFKIILTTDPTLIADGIQSIDDEFLEWFVKNPSCEEVKIEDYGTLYNFKYLILIPKEEPKPMHEQIIEHCGGEEKFKEIAGLKFKQETFEDIKLEEVLGSSYCKYTVIENKLATIYRNQEKILAAIKLLSNEK